MKTSIACIAAALNFQVNVRVLKCMKYPIGPKEFILRPGEIIGVPFLFG